MFDTKSILITIIIIIIIHSLFRCATSEHFSSRRNRSGIRSGNRSGNRGGNRVGGSGLTNIRTNRRRHSTSPIRPTSNGARYGKHHHKGGGTYYGRNDSSYYPWSWYDYVSPWSWYNYYYPNYDYSDYYYPDYDYLDYYDYDYDYDVIYI